MRTKQPRRPLRRHAALAGAAVVAGLAAAGCGGTSSATTQQDVIRLPRNSDFADVAVARDGTVWVTDSFGSVVVVRPPARVDEHRVHPTEELEIPTEIVAGPDGAAWFAGGEAVGRIDATGDVRSHARGQGLRGWPTALAVAGDAIWFATEDPPRVQRMTPDGDVTTTLRVGPARAPFAIDGLAVGPDGALWFTQTPIGRRAPPAAIGRVTTDGRVTRWPLPRRSQPRRIVAGSDGALWFTDRSAIGRITTAGAVTHLPLPPPMTPHDIVRGADGAVWFTSDACVGRVSAGEPMTLWPVAGAGRLAALDPSPGGGFWVLDAIAGRLRRFTPPHAPPDRACGPAGVTRESGRTRAVLAFARLDRHRTYGDHFTDGRIRIFRGGRQVFSEALPPHPRAGGDSRAYGYSPRFAVRDLDGDREPEVWAELNWNGTHCCTWWRIYRYDASRDTYRPATHFWGNGGAEPKLRDLDRDGRPELLSKDDRFAALTGFAGVVRPIRIWSYRSGRFRDVTRRYPRLVRRDAAQLWRLYGRLRERRGNVRYVLAAWAADQHLLGRAAAVERTLADALHRGELRARFSERPRDAAAYVARLERFLRRLGYVRR